MNVAASNSGTNLLQDFGMENERGSRDFRLSFLKVDFFKKNIRPRAPGFFGGKIFKVELKDSTELVARKRKCSGPQ
jgi:hypothetical protein